MCVSGLGAVSLNKPLPALLQPPVRVSFGFDTHRQNKALDFGNIPLSYFIPVSWLLQYCYLAYRDV